MNGLQDRRSLLLRAYDEVLELLISAPTKEELLDFHPSVNFQSEVRHLLHKLKAVTITSEGEHELDQVGNLEHILIALKARAYYELQRKDGRTNND